MKYDNYELDDTILNHLNNPKPPKQSQSLKDSHVDEAVNTYQEFLSKRTIQNLDDIAKVSTNEKLKDIYNDKIYETSKKFVCDPDSLGIEKTKPKPEVKKSSFSITEEKSSNLKDFRELVEEHKTKLCGSEKFAISDKEAYEIFNNKDRYNSYEKCERPVETDYSKLTCNGQIRDPQESSNLYEIFKIEDDSEKSNNSISLCLDIDSEESQAEIIKNTQTHLGRQLVNAIDMKTLDDIAKETYQLEGELKQLSSLKFDKFESVNESLEQAQKALNLERNSQIVKYLEEIIKAVPCDFYDLSPEQQKNFRDANKLLCRALEFYKKSGSDFSTGIAKESIIDATILWPRYKEDSRLIWLMDKILKIDS